MSVLTNQSENPMELPAGYVAVADAAIHVAQLRQHTTDVRRFLRYYPLCRQLEQHAAGSDAWRDVVRGLTSTDRAGVTLTMREAGELLLALAADFEDAT